MKVSLVLDPGVHSTYPGGERAGEKKKPGGPLSLKGHFPFRAPNNQIQKGKGVQGR